MELASMWLTMFSALLGGYLFVFGFFGKVNEWYYVGRFGRNRQYPLPPGDMGWPILGNLFDFLRAFKSQNPNSFISNRVSRYGRTGMYKSHFLGSPSIIVCSPDNCKKVMCDDENFKMGYPKSTTILMGRQTFFNVSTPEHKQVRRLTITPIKAHESLLMFIPSIEQTVIDTLHSWSSSGNPIELGTELRKATFKIINTVFMGPESGSKDQDAIHLYADLTTGIRSLVINFPGFAFHTALKARKSIGKILQKVLDERRERIASKLGGENKKDLIDLLMAVRYEDGTKLEDEDIKDLLQLFMLAGHETSARGVLWSIIYLTQNPRILVRAKEEQENIMKRRPSTQQGLTLLEIKEMTYLSKVIDETLRLTSFNFAHFREAIADVQLNGYTIPKGWKVLVWARGIHMDPHTYPNPEIFDPERWDTQPPKPGSFVPFGLGSRICPGSNLARIEISIFLHHLLLHYKVEAVNPIGPVDYLPLPMPSDNFPARVIKINA